ncbi:MAG: uberolysin/carnocyclin family circular bacteriocin [Micrococcus sp.]|nr:uberolysin/carnocyclin family circular bacteriocin [Micrococcus sp.]
MSTTATVATDASATRRSLGIAAALSVVGLVAGGVALAWVAGSLGISTAAASQIVNAVQVGGLALTLVAAAFGFGVGSALVATIRWYILRKGKSVAIA